MSGFRRRRPSARLGRQPEFQERPRPLDRPHAPCPVRAALDARPQLRHLGDAVEDFDDTAAIISLVDLVISSDTSVVHLAGALGKPVWIVLHHAADWRWLQGRSDSPWYPTARLFRQPRFDDDWEDVIGHVKRELMRI